MPAGRRREHARPAAMRHHRPRRGGRRAPGRLLARRAPRPPRGGAAGGGRRERRRGRHGAPARDGTATVRADQDDAAALSGSMSSTQLARRVSSSSASVRVGDGEEVEQPRRGFRQPRHPRRRGHRRRQRLSAVASVDAAAASSVTKNGTPPVAASTSSTRSSPRGSDCRGREREQLDASAHLGRMAPRRRASGCVPAISGAVGEHDRRRRPPAAG